MKIKETREEHRKQLVKSSCEKEPFKLLKQKEIFEELANERMGEIQNLRKQIDFNNLTYYLRVKVVQEILSVLMIN